MAFWACGLQLAPCRVWDKQEEGSLFSPKRVLSAPKLNRGQRRVENEPCSDAGMARLLGRKGRDGCVHQFQAVKLRPGKQSDFLKVTESHP